MGSAIMAAVMMELNTRPRAMTAAVLVALLAAFTLGYTPD